MSPDIHTRKCLSSFSLQECLILSILWWCFESPQSWLKNQMILGFLGTINSVILVKLAIHFSRWISFLFSPLSLYFLNFSVIFLFFWLHISPFLFPSNTLRAIYTNPKTRTHTESRFVKSQLVWGCVLSDIIISSWKATWVRLWLSKWLEIMASRGKAWIWTMLDFELVLFTSLQV